MGLRTIYWLRQRKVTREGVDIPPTAMAAVRRALAMLQDLDLKPWTDEGGPTVAVDAAGHIFVDRGGGEVEDLAGARPIDRDWFNLIEPFNTLTSQGPDLQKPREHLRIVPGKLSGSPHVAHTRLETVTIAALRARGFGQDGIERLYPGVPPIAIAESIDLERQLDENLLAA